MRFQSRRSDSRSVRRLVFLVRVPEERGRLELGRWGRVESGRTRAPTPSRATLRCAPSRSAPPVKLPPSRPPAPVFTPACPPASSRPVPPPLSLCGRPRNRLRPTAADLRPTAGLLRPTAQPLQPNCVNLNICRATAALLRPHEACGGAAVVGPQWQRSVAQKSAVLLQSPAGGAQRERRRTHSFPGLAMDLEFPGRVRERKGLDQRGTGVVVRDVDDSLRWAFCPSTHARKGAGDTAFLFARAGRGGGGTMYSCGETGGVGVTGGRRERRERGTDRVREGEGATV